MTKVSTTLHDETMCEMMKDRAHRSRFAMSIGSTNATSEVFVETVTEDDESDDECESMEVEDCLSWRRSYYRLFEDWDVRMDMEDLDAFTVSAT